MKPRGPACQPHYPDKGAQPCVSAFGQQAPPLCLHPRPRRHHRFPPTVWFAALPTSAVLHNYKRRTPGLSLPLSATTPFTPPRTLPLLSPPSNTLPVSASSARSPAQLTHPRNLPRPRATHQPIKQCRWPLASNISGILSALLPAAMLSHWSVSNPLLQPHESPLHHAGVLLDHFPHRSTAPAHHNLATAAACAIGHYSPISNLGRLVLAQMNNAICCFSFELICFNFKSNFKLLKFIGIWTYSNKL
jgi:hypothetical protein